MSASATELVACPPYRLPVVCRVHVFRSVSTPSASRRPRSDWLLWCSLRVAEGGQAEPFFPG